MTTRTTKVRLSAEIQSYVDGMQQAAKATRETGTEAEKLGQQQEAIQRLGVASMAMGAAAAAGATLAVAKWADFDQAMSAVQAATMESEENMQRLSDAALEAGARTVFSAEESANAIEELAKAGVSTADILNGALDGALDLAAAGGLGVAEAAGIAATALKTFKLEGSDMAHVADLLAAGAGKAMGDVTDLSMALNQSAMVANASGLSIEETTGALAAFASQGLLGSDAGTSFKSMLQSLTPTSGAAAETMKQLGISAYDSSGNFIGLAAFAGQLEGALKNLTVEQQQAALKTIFGSDAIRAATVLYSEGEQGIRGWIDAVDDQGYAAEQAAARLDNLKGDIEALGGALDTAFIKTGSGANDALRAMVQWATEAVDAYNDLPAPLQSAALAVGILAAAAGLAGGGLLLLIPKVYELKIALDTFGVSTVAATTALKTVGTFLTGPWGIALGAASLAMYAFSQAVEYNTYTQDELRGALKQTTDASEALKASFEQGAVSTWFYGDLKEEIEDLPAILDKVRGAGDGFWRWFSTTPTDKTILDTIAQSGAALADMAENDLPTAQREFREFVDSFNLDDDQVAQLLLEMPEFRAHLVGVAEDLGLAADDATLLELALGGINPVAEDNAKRLEQLQGVARDTSEEISTLADEIKGFGSAQFDVERATLSFAEAVNDLQAKIAESGGSLDVWTEAGQDTNRAMLDVAKSTNEYAGALALTGGTTEEIQGVLEAGRQTIINTRIALGESEEAARAYADELIATPEVVASRMELDTSAAASALHAWLASIPSVVQIGVGTYWMSASDEARAATRNADGNMYAYANGGIESYAGGGFPAGIYSGGAPIHKFAEPETIWEAYISGKPDQRDRNRQIWIDAGDRLGMGEQIGGEIRAALKDVLGHQSSSSRTTNVTINNPVTRDPFQDAWEAAQGKL